MRKLLLHDPKKEAERKEKELAELYAAASNNCDYSNYTFDSSGYIHLQQGQLYKVMLSNMASVYPNGEIVDDNSYRNLALTLRNALIDISTHVDGKSRCSAALIKNKCDTALELAKGKFLDEGGL